MHSFVRDVYRGTVSFDVCNDGLSRVGEYVVSKFLDLWIYLDWCSISFNLVVKNDLFSLSNIASLKQKNRFPIPTGRPSDHIDRITSDLKARLARFVQLSLSRNQMFLHLVVDF